MMSKKRAGFALCGSYCTYDKAIAAARRLVESYDLTVIMSENAASTSTRFGRAEDFVQELEEISGKPVICTITTAEPIGPKALFDVLLIAPCTGNTLSKLAHGVTDTAVTMAAKSHLRNGRPLVIAVSTNDGLSGSMMSIGTLMNRKNVYFVPFGQDDAFKKPCSLVADFDWVEGALEAALQGEQVQPVLCAYR
jgi:dipicolinate synthase subunit B